MIHCIYSCEAYKMTIKSKHRQTGPGVKYLKSIFVFLKKKCRQLSGREHHPPPPPRWPEQFFELISLQNGLPPGHDIKVAILRF